jgi:hypothetical protein
MRGPPLTKWTEHPYPTDSVLSYRCSLPDIQLRHGTELTSSFDRIDQIPSKSFPIVRVDVLPEADILSTVCLGEVYAVFKINTAVVSVCLIPNPTLLYQMPVTSIKGYREHGTKSRLIGQCCIRTTYHSHWFWGASICFRCWKSRTIAIR